MLQFVQLCVSSDTNNKDITGGNSITDLTLIIRYKNCKNCAKHGFLAINVSMRKRPRTGFEHLLVSHSKFAESQ